MASDTLRPILLAELAEKSRRRDQETRAAVARITNSPMWRHHRPAAPVVLDKRSPRIPTHYKRSAAA